MKLLICLLIFASVYAAADSDVKYTENKPDWESVNKTLLQLNIKNQKFIEESYQQGLNLVYLTNYSNPVPFPNIYFSILSYKLVEVYVESQWAYFYYDILILNRWTNKTTVLKVATNALKNEARLNEINGNDEIGKGVQPIASLGQVIEPGKFNVKYNALEILYNQTLLSKLYGRAEQEIRAKVSKDLKKDIQGSFAKAQPYFFANVTDEGVVFEFTTSIVPGPASIKGLVSAEKRVVVTLFFNPTNQQLSVRAISIAEKWWFSNVFVQPKNPQVNDAIISFPQIKN